METPPKEYTNPDGLNKAPTDYTKPRNITQSPNIQCKQFQYHFEESLAFRYCICLKCDEYKQFRIYFGTRGEYNFEVAWNRINYPTNYMWQALFEELHLKRQCQKRNNYVIAKQKNVIVCKKIYFLYGLSVACVI